MYDAKKRVIRFIKKLPGDYKQEDIISELIRKDLRDRGISQEEFEMEAAEIARVLDGPAFH